MKRKIILTVLSVVALVVFGGGVYAYYLFHSVKETATKMHEEVKLSTPHEAPKITPEQNNEHIEPISILLLGVDERKNDVGRSDTMIVMTLNPEKKKMQMISIPRDTRTEIVGHGTVDKINHAYAFGGPSMSIDTVENFTGIKIDYFIRVNMEALSGLVDAVGGVTVHNNLDWTESGYHYKKGELSLDGKHALAYARMRHDDPNGDFGRNERQRQIIMAIINKAASFSSVTKFDDILNVLGNNVKTNLTFDNMMDIQKNYRDCRENLEQYEVKGKGEMINKIYYLDVPDEEKQKVTNMLKSNLDEN
ncbi:LCP family glycopolymer transferase [Falsibacillus albus]|uniref:Polyisoprenyl-teichoic acid--peptidoglycan teichoic acid transferase TagU n=1 Tax=Falsibacillus albus TaxID=2478915 RepID=A0A3L7JW03_9BACI|nr:LCP family protein [Falsibacillus albus]RLQ94903.1 transcriptional regulator LytR [Falsibacillus albus]